MTCEGAGGNSQSIVDVPGKGWGCTCLEERGGGSEVKYQR